MTSQANLVWVAGESAKMYVLTLTSEGSPIDLTGATVKIISSAFSGGELDVTSGVQSPASGGVVHVQPTAVQIPGVSSGSGRIKITFANSTVRFVPENGATFQITIKEAT